MAQPGKNWVSPNRRYIGSFHWNAYWGHWDKIVGIEKNKATGNEEWVAQKVSVEGVSQNRPRRHTTPLDPGTFAVKPFDVKSMTTFKKEEKPINIQQLMADVMNTGCLPST